MPVRPCRPKTGGASQDEELIQDEAEEVEEVTDDEDLTAQDVAEDDVEEEEDIVSEDQDIVLEQQEEETELQVIGSEEDDLAGSVEVQTADQGYQVLTADEEAEVSEKTEEQIAAEEYLKTNYIDGTNKVIPANSTKSEDGRTYTIGLKTPSGNSVERFTLKYESSTSNYVTGWYIEENEYLSKKDPAVNGRITILKRPTKPYSFTATLKLFAKGTATTAINDGTATALATQDFTFILEAEEVAEPTYTMTVKVQDESGNPITDADVALNKGSDTVDLTDGSYVMEKGADYTLTVKKTGYDDYTENISDFNPTDTNTVKTIILTKKNESKIVKFVVIDSVTKQVIQNAAITVKKDYYTSIKPDSDGSYNLIKGTTYKYTVEATNYKTIRNQDFAVGDEDTITIELTKDISKYTVSFKPVDTDETIIANASVTVTYEDEDDWGDPETVTLKPNEDGSYTMDKSTTYTYTVKADGYKDVAGTYKPSGTEEVIELPVTMQKEAVEVTEYKVTVQAVDSETKEAIANAAIKVTYEDYDTYYENPYTAELKANEDGTYTMKKDVEYTCTVTADGYEAGTAAYTPDGKNATATVSVSMVKKPVATEDQKTVDAIKAKFDKESAIRPNYAKDKNILDVVKAKISGYTDIVDSTDVTVSIKSSDDTKHVEKDGTIHYRAESLNSWGMNFSNVGIVYIIEKNGAKAETNSSTATICWNRDYYNKQIESEKNSLTWEKIKGSNDVQTEVTSDLTLPQIMTNSSRTAWSEITWTSSAPEVISIDKTGLDGITDPKKGTIHAQPEDKEVTLTATFQANDGSLNSNVERVSDFATYTVEFTVTVKGTGATAPTEEELLTILNQYYTVDRITEFEDKTKVADLANCKTDLQLPLYTRIKDTDGERVFQNKEIVVTSSNTDVMTINGYRAVVDRFAKNEDTTINLIVTFTREGVTVSKEIPVTIKPITEADVQDELAMMEAAKVHYFDGINDGQYADKDSITGNLHPFQEMVFDEAGSPKWIYNNDDKTGKGIIPDDMIDDSWEMEGAGYNKFKSSNNAVVQHENLVVNRKETDTQITISSVLSSERYGEYAKKYPNNTVLQKLYKQPVSVTVTIKGTKPSVENLQAQIKELQDLLNSITEGAAPGQYPEGTKDRLQTAVTEAEALLEKEDATEEELEAEAAELAKLLKEVKNSQNEEAATVTAKISLRDGSSMDVSKMTVKAHTAEDYGYTKPEEYKNQVTVLDILAAWHVAKYGNDFKNNPKDYLDITVYGYLDKIDGKEGLSLGFLVNNLFPGDNGASTAVVKTGDIVTVFEYGDSKKWLDLYLYFSELPETVNAKENINLTLYGYHPMKYDEEGKQEAPSVRSGYTVAALDAKGNRVAAAVTDKNGAAILQINTAGTYKITVVETPEGSTESAYIFPEDKVTVIASEEPEHTHSFSKWRTVSVATVFSAAKQERTCKCGEKETRTVGKALTPTIKVSMTSVSLEVKQTTTKLTVSGLAKGDSVVSYKTSNSKIFTVDKKGKITAGTIAGNATLTITLKSGLKKNVAVKVHSFSKWRTVSAATVFSAAKQERTCKCGKKETRTVGKALKPTMRVNMTTVPLKVKQTTTKLKVSGLAKGDAVVSYKTGNSKIFTVDKKGKLIAGTTAGSAKLTITLKSGLKKTITVKVQKTAVQTQKIQGLTKTLILKKGKKATLKPVLQPLTSTQKISYTSADKKVATVSANGVITAKKVGKTIITVKAGNKNFKITVNVK